jgi:uncharacterized protein with HEPN domain
MPSERIAKCFSDALTAITLIKTWVDEAGGADHAIFHDLKARSAIERQLLVISEAAIRLDKLDPAVAARLAPNIDWPGIRGIGNFIRHKYDDLDTTIVVDVIHNRLDELKGACERALQELAKE